MKLDVNQLRYLGKDDFRVLQAVELGQKNHELVPVALVDSIAGLKHGGTIRCLKVLLKAKLVHHENTTYDGYRLTYLGYDYLAIKSFLNRGAISSVGRQIGVGKEADVFEVMNEEGEVMALKLHRLGRTSFRAVKSKRDYLRHRNSFSWLYLSRLAALKEFAFMAALGNHGFPVPKAIDSNRHAVLMSLIDAFPLVQVRELEHPGKVYRQCMDIMSRLAAKGLIHCDFNEFNLLINEDEELTLIDFPQMVSVGHGNARELFYRDVECVIRFFKKKIGYIPEHDSSLPYVRPDFEALLGGLEGDISQELRASGFEREHELSLEQWTAQQPLNEHVQASAAASNDSGSLDEAEGDCLADSEVMDGAGPCTNARDAGEVGQNESNSGSVMGELQQHLQETAVTRSSGIHGQDLVAEDDRSTSEKLSNLDRAEKLLGNSGVLGHNVALQDSRVLPSETTVQERLLNEKRRAKQADRMKAAARSAHKTSSKRTRRKGGVAIDI